jgi:hypothetical protein
MRTQKRRNEGSLHGDLARYGSVDHPIGVSLPACPLATLEESTPALPLLPQAHPARLCPLSVVRSATGACFSCPVGAASASSVTAATRYIGSSGGGATAPQAPTNRHLTNLFTTTDTTTRISVRDSARARTVCGFACVDVCQM